MTVEILFCAWNRLAFTEASMTLLKRNTDWSQVSRLVVYDDNSEDGTRDYLARAGEDIEVRGYEVRDGGWHSTGATMNDYIALTEADAFVKIDNDIAMPPGWLGRLLAAAERNPDYDLLGMEAGWCQRFEKIHAPKVYGVEPSRHIGGVGLMRTAAFEQRKPIPLSLGKNGRAGFTIWQHRYHARTGWLTPDLPNVQLDKIPAEPWASLAAHYCEQGWSRAWDPYTDDMEAMWAWLPKDVMRRAVSARVRLRSS